MIRKFIEKIQSGEIPVQYRDPQEFIYGDERSDKSDAYSYGMYFFREIAGADYFECAGVPEDEFFMMADPDSDSSVIDKKYIPEEFQNYADLLKNMTVFRRDMRISVSEAEDILSGLIKENENTAESGTETEESVQEDLSEDKESISASPQIHDRYAAEADYDYGIILNNRRSGRIEFRPLLFCTGKTESYSVPVEKNGRFVIAVSRRHRDYSGISNPSSVYGDRIIPVGLAEAEDVDSAKLRISVENPGGKLSVKFEALSSEGKETGKSYQVKWGEV